MNGGGEVDLRHERDRQSKADSETQHLLLIYASPGSVDAARLEVRADSRE